MVFLSGIDNGVTSYVDLMLNVVLRNNRNTMFNGNGSVLKKHGISIRNRSWCSLVNGFDAERSSGER